MGHWYEKYLYFHYVYCCLPALGRESRDFSSLPRTVPLKDETFARSHGFLDFCMHMICLTMLSSCDLSNGDCFLTDLVVKVVVSITVKKVPCLKSFFLRTPLTISNSKTSKYGMNQEELHYLDHT